MHRHTEHSVGTVGRWSGISSTKMHSCPLRSCGLAFLTLFDLGALGESSPSLDLSAMACVFNDKQLQIMPFDQKGQC